MTTWVAVAFLTAFAIPAGLGQTSPVYPEYEIRTVTTLTSDSRKAADGSITVSRIFFGRRDGSRGARTTEIINGRSCTSTTYWDIRKRVEVTASDCLGMKTTAPFTRLRDFPGPALASCDTTIASPLVGREVIQGLPVEKFETDTPTDRSVNYHAPALGCLLVRALSYSKGPDGRIKGTSFDEPVEIRLRAPDPSLFETPESFREVSPVERKHALYQYFSLPPGAP
jgi:hypothetical protein